MDAVEEKIDNQELTIEVAERLFDWKWVQTMGGRQRDLVFMSPQDAGRYLPEYILPRPEGWRECWSRDLPDYANDMSAAFQMEERIKELGRERDYANALSILIAESDHQRLYVEPFDLIHAPAEIRCRAALQIFKSEGE